MGGWEPWAPACSKKILLTGSYGQEKSGKKVCFQVQSGKVRKCQEILLKLEESQEKVRKCY